MSKKWELCRTKNPAFPTLSLKNMEVYGKFMTTRTEQSFRKAGSDNMEEKIRVLLADDDSEFCARMAAALENAGDMELAGIAEDGGKALAAVGELHPDLLIIDLVLPVLDGITVLSRLHA